MAEKGDTVLNPVSFANLLLSHNIIPGDTLLLRAGTYSGDYVLPYIAGTEALPITIKPYNGETVIFDGSLTVGNYVRLYDLNFTDARIDRHIYTPGIYATGLGFHMHGCIVSDIHNSGLSWYGYGVGEVSENIFLNNGGRNGDESGHGHALYTHNAAGGAHLIARNLFFDQFGTYALHIYSAGSNGLKDYTVEDNITCGQPTHTGGGLGLTDFIYRRNIQYGSYIQQGRYSGSHKNINGQIKDNVTFDLVSYSVNADCTYEWENLVESGNIAYGGEPSNRAGYVVVSNPAVWTRVIPFSKSERWAASVAIYNRESAETVSVDFTGLANGNYKFRNAQNPAETSDFTYSGGSVDVPTNWTAAQRIGDAQPTTTWPVFGGLVVERA